MVPLRRATCTAKATTRRTTRNGRRGHTLIRRTSLETPATRCRDTLIPMAIQCACLCAVKPVLNALARRSVVPAGDGCYTECTKARVHNECTLALPNKEGNRCIGVYKWACARVKTCTYNCDTLRHLHTGAIRAVLFH